MKKLELCLSTDDNYAKYASTVICSANCNKSDDEELIFHILYSNLTDENIEKLASCGNVIFHKIDNAIFEPYFNNGVCKNVTIPTLYRLMLPSLLPNADRILYLDCDLIVLSSLWELFNVDLNEDQYAACVKDLGSNEHIKRMGFEFSGDDFYFNAGVCLFNLKKMRHENIQDKMFDYLKQNWQKLSYSDQDVLNAVLYRHVKRMDKKFNFITYNFYFSNDINPVIAHFAGVKPWKVGFYNVYREMFWKYFLMTPFKDDKSQNMMKNSVLFMHNRICQILWYIKMYPLFFLNKSRISDFMRIVRNSEINP